jgi:hypothetical protein
MDGEGRARRLELWPHQFNRAPEPLLARLAAVSCRPVAPFVGGWPSHDSRTRTRTSGACSPAQCSSSSLTGST